MSSIMQLLIVVVVVYLAQVRGVYPNHEVVMFQPRTVTSTYLGSVFNCYISYYSY